jgi:prevent-host-death family protein
MRVGVRELRNQTAALIRRAGQGERVIVTVDGRPVAQLGPIERDGSSLDELVSRGLVVAARRSDRGRPGSTYAPYSGFRLDRVLQELRGR